MRILLIRAGCSVLLLLSASCGVDSQKSEGPDRPPNVILYLVDTLREDSTEPYGNEVVSTPAITELAREGTLFERAYAQSSWTRSSIASILTGFHPDTHGIEGRQDGVSEDWRLLPEILKERGYETACVTSNPNVGSFFGFDQGYDEFTELYARRSAGIVTAKEAHAHSSEVTDRAIEWIESTDGPFFLFILATDPHWPYDPPDEFDRYAGDYAGEITGGSKFNRWSRIPREDEDRVRSLYYGEIASNDDSLGTLLEYMKAREDYDDTVFVLTSDHGEEFWEHGWNGHGNNLYEEVLRVPLIVRYPHRFGPGSRAARRVELVDLFPTLLDLTGGRIPEDRDGQLLMGKSSGDNRSVYAKLSMRRRDAEVLLQHPWKLYVDHRLSGEHRIRLYDLDSDPGETRDVSPENPDRVAAMLELLAHRKKTADVRRARIGRVQRPTGGDLPDDVAEALEVLGYAE